jgi:hypothetical protein
MNDSKRYQTFQYDEILAAVTDRVSVPDGYEIKGFTVNAYTTKPFGPGSPRCEITSEIGLKHIFRYPCSCHESGVCWIVRHPSQMPPISYDTEEDAINALDKLLSSEIGSGHD